MNPLSQIHSRKMNVRPDVNLEELARSTDDFNGAQLKAVCVEAGMLALRRDATEVSPHWRNSFCSIYCKLSFCCFSELSSILMLHHRSLMRTSMMALFKCKLRREPVLITTHRDSYRYTLRFLTVNCTCK